MSKVVILLFISAIQAFLFVMVGNLILEVKAMYWQYWLVLFSSWTVAILFGLNISNSFKTAVTVYILIPFLVIPNIILSGIMVKFEKLNPQITTPGTIPFYGEIIPARWAYEALATYQYTNNKYERNFFKYDELASNANYKKDYWITALKNKVNDIARNLNKEEYKESNINGIELLRYELTKENKIFQEKNRKDFILKDIALLSIETFNTDTKTKLLEHIGKLRKYYVAVAKKADQKKDELMRRMQKNEFDKDNLINLKRDYFNQSLADFVKNKNSLAIIEYDNRLFQKVDPIYQIPDKPFVSSHFYSSHKNLFGYKTSTFWVNLFVLWFIAILLYITLYYNLFRRIIDKLGKLIDKIFPEKD
jgi:hypothetical protein